jgi:ribosome-associated protein
MNFPLEGTEHIELIGLLKTLGIAETGGHAKQIVDDGMVKLNGEIESRKRAKLRSGDIIEVEGVAEKIKITK